MRKLKNNILNLQRCIREFGFFNGTKVFFQMNGKRGKIHPKKLPHPLYFRPKNREDKYSFYELFLQKQYHFNFDFSPEYIIDAGANIGYASVYFSNRYPNAKIIALEPDTNNFKLLLKNTQNYPNVTPVQCALWKDREGVNISNPNAGNRGYMVDNQSNEIPSHTVESLMKEFSLPRIDILKMDIEGAEQEVFESNADWLNHTAALFIELHDRMRPYSSVPFFKEIGKHKFLHEISGENLLFYKPLKK